MYVKNIDFIIRQTTLDKHEHPDVMRELIVNIVHRIGFVKKQQLGCFNHQQ